MTWDDVRLADTAHKVLSQLDPADLERVSGHFVTTDDIVAGMCACARQVADTLGEPVPGEHVALLLAATLTFGKQHTGVHKNVDHARNAYQVIRRYAADLPVPIAVHLRADDPAEFVGGLVAAHRISEELAPSRPEPPLFVMMVAVAVAAREPSRASDRQAKVAEAILDRGGELAARHRATRPPAPTPRRVLGSTDFVVALAAYGAAFGELSGVTAEAGADPLAAIDRSLPGLESALHRAMTVPRSRPPFRGADEPDALGFFSAAATAVGGPTARQIFDRLYRGLRRLRIESDDKLVPTEPGQLHAATVGAVEMGPAAALALLDDLTVRVVELLTRDTTVAEQAVVADWVCGRRPLNRLDWLDLLLWRMRVLTRGLATSIRRPAAQLPMAAPGSAQAEMAAVLRERIEHAGVVRSVDREPIVLVLTALPPLWTARAPISRALMQRIMIDEGWRGASRRITAKVLATSTARGPGHIFGAAVMAEAHKPDQVCATVPTEAEVPRCVERLGEAATVPAPNDVCPARPWNEVGIVETYLTLAQLTCPPDDDIHKASEDVRKRIERYEGRWKALAAPDGSRWSGSARGTADRPGR
ncbi:hypothetical protein AB1484_33125 [Parafrankia sp. FMc6]|uniref:hypothetical protein n=1 Tax=Parafrankia soli TaxID=2599596 RepID=UPI0034D6B9C2